MIRIFGSTILIQLAALFVVSFHALGETVAECSMKSMMPLVTLALQQYAQDVATQRRIDFVPNSFQAKYLGTKDIVDTKYIEAKSQHTFNLTFKTERGSEMTFITPTERICEGQYGICLYPDNAVLLALPEPQIFERRDSEGILVSRTCVQKSHAGTNRHVLLFNVTEQQVVFSDLISYSKGTFVSAEMPLEP